MSQRAAGSRRERGRVHAKGTSLPDLMDGERAVTVVVEEGIQCGEPAAVRENPSQN